MRHGCRTTWESSRDCNCKRGHESTGAGELRSTLRLPPEIPRSDRLLAPRARLLGQAPRERPESENTKVRSFGQHAPADSTPIAHRTPCGRPPLTPPFLAANV